MTTRQFQETIEYLCDADQCSDDLRTLLTLEQIEKLHFTNTINELS